VAAPGNAAGWSLTEPAGQCRPGRTVAATTRWPGRRPFSTAPTPGIVSFKGQPARAKPYGGVSLTSRPNLFLGPVGPPQPSAPARAGPGYEERRGGRGVVPAAAACSLALERIQTEGLPRTPGRGLNCYFPAVSRGRRPGPILDDRGERAGAAFDVSPGIRHETRQPGCLGRPFFSRSPRESGQYKTWSIFS